MGLYIDMEMPQNCQSCNFYNGLGCKATGRMFAIFYNVATRRSDCPLIEVSEPHGRLIDADEMFDEFVAEGQRSKRYKLGEKWELNGEEIRSVISRLPTVIPASEEG